MPRLRDRVLTIVTTLVTAATLTPAPAPARPADAVAAYLAAHPGGQQINAHEISYNHGALIITVTPPTPAITGPDCPAGWFCFYALTYYGYPRGKLSDCGWQNLATWGWQDRIQSVYYNMLNGSVSFIHHTPGTSYSSDYTLFTISPSRPGIPDVYPYRRMADFVYRYC